MLLLSTVESLCWVLVFGSGLCCELAVSVCCECPPNIEDTVGPVLDGLKTDDLVVSISLNREGFLNKEMLEDVGLEDPNKPLVSTLSVLPKRALVFDCCKEVK